MRCPLPGGLGIQQHHAHCVHMLSLALWLELFSESSPTAPLTLYVFAFSEDTIIPTKILMPVFFLMLLARLQLRQCVNMKTNMPVLRRLIFVWQQFRPGRSFVGRLIQMAVFEVSYAPRREARASYEYGK